jgi:hypothetical protein
MRRLLVVPWCMIATACVFDHAPYAQLPIAFGVTTDSLAHAFRTYYGRAPHVLSACGPGRLLIAFRDAPGDVRERSARIPGGRKVWVDATVEQGRAAFAEELAAIALSTFADDAAVDTISVRLLRSSGSSVEFSTFVDRDPVTHGRELRRIRTSVRQCAPVA